MLASQYCYWELWQSILNWEGSSLYSKVLAVWIEKNVGERDWLASFASRLGDPIPPVESEELCRLYTF